MIDRNRADTEAKNLQGITSQKTAQKDAQMFEQLVATSDKKTVEDTTRSVRKIPFFSVFYC